MEGASVLCLYVHCLPCYYLIRSISNFTYNSLTNLVSGPIQTSRLTNYFTDLKKKKSELHIIINYISEDFSGMLLCCVPERLLAGVSNVLTAFNFTAKHSKEIHTRQSIIKMNLLITSRTPNCVGRVAQSV